MVSKWVADAFGKDGIYPMWIAMRRYPWLPAREYRDRGETAAHVMKPAANLVVVRDGDRGCALRELDALVRARSFRGFPVVQGELLLGIVMRDRLRECLGEFRFISGTGAGC